MTRPAPPRRRARNRRHAAGRGARPARPGRPARGRSDRRGGAPSVGEPTAPVASDAAPSASVRRRPRSACSSGSRIGARRARRRWPPIVRSAGRAAPVDRPRSRPGDPRRPRRAARSAPQASAAAIEARWRPSWAGWFGRRAVRAGRAVRRPPGRRQDHHHRQDRGARARAATAAARACWPPTGSASARSSSCASTPT